LDGAECHYLGLATHYVEQAALPDMIDRIASTPQRVQGPIGTFATTPPEAKIEQNLPQITRFFASDSFEEILAALEADESDWAQTELNTLRTKSPLSCKVSLRLMVEGANRASFTDEMRAEYALAGRVARTHDFREGVRALLIDKTGDPQWDPATPEEVSDEMLDVLFAPLPETEAWTPFPETQE
jgi:enoyl-CoA hydratase